MRAPVLTLVVLSACSSAPEVNPKDVERAQIVTVEIAAAAKQFRTNEGRCPDSLTEVRAEGFIKDLSVDPWGSPYAMKCEGESVRITSPGPDKQAGTEDDIAAD